MNMCIVQVTLFIGHVIYGISWDKQHYIRYCHTYNFCCVLLLYSQAVAMAEGPPMLGGYDCEFINEDQIPDELMCLICNHVAKDPEQMTCCGKVFCDVCLKSLGKKPCPTCRSKKIKHYPDKRGNYNIYKHCNSQHVHTIT